MKKTAAFTILSILPGFAFAQTFNGNFITTVVNFLGTIVHFAFPFLTAIAVIVFIVEVIKYIYSTPEKKKESAKGLLYSVIALFLVLSIFGIIDILQNISGTGGINQVQGQQIPGVSGF